MAGDESESNANRGEPSDDENNNEDITDQNGTEESNDAPVGGEYEALNERLDELNTCLDTIEQQNDVLYSQLQELLESSRQARLEFVNQLKNCEDDHPNDDDSEMIDK